MFVSAQPVLMGFVLVAFWRWVTETFSHTACFFTYCISSSRAFRIKAGSNHPPLTSSQYFPSRIEFSSCTICPPSLLRLRLFSIWGVKSTGLVCVPLAKCIMADVWPSLPPCCRRPSQISEARFYRLLDPSTRLAICGLFVRKFTRPPSRLPLASPSAWKTSCLNSKRTMHGRESCDATPLGSCKNQAPLLICSWCNDCTEQDAHTRSDDKSSGATCGPTTICFVVIFGVAEVLPFALLRSGSKVKDVTLHTPREVTLCWWPLLVAQHLPPAQDSVNRVLPVHS